MVELGGMSLVGEWGESAISTYKNRRAVSIYFSVETAYPSLQNCNRNKMEDV